MTKTVDNSESGNSPAISHPQPHVLAGVRQRQIVNFVAALYWLGIFTGTHIPQPELLIGPEVSDKFLHFSAYLGLFLILSARLRIIHSRWPGSRQLISLTLLTGAYALLDELLQLVPGINRHADFNDVLADWAGVACGLVLAFLTGNRLNSRRRTDSA